MKDFDDFVKKQYGDSLRPPDAHDTSDHVENYKDDVDGDAQLPNTDTFLTEVLLPQDGEHM